MRRLSYPYLILSVPFFSASGGFSFVIVAFSGYLHLDNFALSLCHFYFNFPWDHLTHSGILEN